MYLFDSFMYVCVRIFDMINSTFIDKTVYVQYKNILYKLCWCLFCYRNSSEKNNDELDVIDDKDSQHAVSWTEVTQAVFVLHMNWTKGTC